MESKNNLFSQKVCFLLNKSYQVKKNLKTHPKADRNQRKKNSKKDVIHLPNSILCSYKKEGTLNLCNNLEIIIMLSEINQSENDKYYMISAIGGI